MDWLRVRAAELRAGHLWPEAGGLHLLWIGLAAVAGLVVLILVLGSVMAARLAPMVRTKLVAMLQAELGPQVRVGEVHTHFNGGLRVDVDGMEAASVQRGIAGDAAKPMLHVDHVQANMGLMAAITAMLGKAGTDTGGSGTTGGGMREAMAHLQRVTLEGVHLRFDNGSAGHAPLQFDLPHVELTGLDRFGSRRMFDYKATVDAGAPIGLVETQGTMGPWNAGDPRATPLQGTFAFEKRSVAAVHGLRGLLSMEAKYAGTLSTMETEGSTHDPAFCLDVSAHPVDLQTTFKMRLDAAHDVVTIEALDAHFLRTHFQLAGTVTKATGGGYQLDMALNVPDGRVEDALVLGAPTEPPLLRGGLTMTGRLLMPAGSAPIAHKLQLQGGRFRLVGVQFGRASVQRSADELSEKAAGHPQNANGREASATSAEVTGDVALENSVMRLTAVRLLAPGTALALNGRYLLGGGGFDMTGTLHTSATASEMHSGLKSVLMRPFNGLFSHGRDGATLPLKVTGRGNEPHFEVTLPGGAKMDALQ